MRHVLDDLIAERYRPVSTPSPAPAPQKDTPATLAQRQRLLAELPGDEMPGEEPS